MLPGCPQAGHQRPQPAPGTATSIGGDPEAVPAEVELHASLDGGGHLRFTAPGQPGHYRLFVEVRDGRGHAAYANLPFRVQLPAAE